MANLKIQIQSLKGSVAQLGGVLEPLLQSTHVYLSPEERVEIMTLFCFSRCTRTCLIITLRILKTHFFWLRCLRIFVSPFVCKAVRFCSVCFHPILDRFDKIFTGLFGLTFRWTFYFVDFIMPFPCHLGRPEWIKRGFEAKCSNQTYGLWQPGRHKWVKTQPKATKGTRKTVAKHCRRNV